MNLNIEQICIPGELYVCTSVDVFLWPQALSLSMAFRGTALAESAYSPWLIPGLFAVCSSTPGSQVQIQKAEERQALQAECQRLGGNCFWKGQPRGDAAGK